MGPRGRRATLADVGGALARGAPARGGAARARDRRGRRGRHVPADGARGRDRRARVRARRSGAGADLLGLRRSRCLLADRRRRREARAHRGRVVPARPARPDEGGAGRGARGRAERRASPRLASRERRMPDDLGARLVVGGRRRGSSGRARARGRRERSPVPPRIHLGNDGKAKGGAARAGRLPAVDRARDRVPGGPPRRRSRALLDRHGLDHGAVDRRRRDGLRRDGRLHGGRARLAARPRLADRRGRTRDDARRVADARARPDPARRAGRRPLVATRRRDDGRAVEPRPVRLAERACLWPRPRSRS